MLHFVKLFLLCLPIRFYWPLSGVMSSKDTAHHILALATKMILSTRFR